MENDKTKLNNPDGSSLSPALDAQPSGVYVDPLETGERKKRNEEITSYFKNYSDDAKHRLDFRRKARKRLLIGTIITIILFIILFIVGSTLCIYYFRDNFVTILSSLIPIAVSLVSLIIGLLEIMIKYVFPTSEDQDFVSIIKTTLENDISAKKIDADFSKK